MRNYERYGFSLEEWKKINKNFKVRYGGRPTKEESEFKKEHLKFKVKTGKFVIEFK